MLNTEHYFHNRVSSIFQLIDLLWILNGALNDEKVFLRDTLLS